jgi:hypothetical protein
VLRLDDSGCARHGGGRGCRHRSRWETWGRARCAPLRNQVGRTFQGWLVRIGIRLNVIDADPARLCTLAAIAPLPEGLVACAFSVPALDLRLVAGLRTLGTPDPRPASTELITLPAPGIVRMLVRCVARNGNHPMFTSNAERRRRWRSTSWSFLRLSAAGGAGVRISCRWRESRWRRG